MRLAWFTPWPPQQSGIAGRSAEILPILAAADHGIDVFVDEQHVPVAARAGAGGPEPGKIRVQSAHDFVWRHARNQFDLVVYQIGNSRLHEFTWPYLFRYPGLTVLHDARLHHARGRALLLGGKTDEYRAEFAWNHPSVCEDAAELGVRGFEGTYYYEWPMVRRVLAASKLVATHSPGGVAEITAAWPDEHVEYITLGEGGGADLSAIARTATRASLGLPPVLKPVLKPVPENDAPVFGVFGALTAEKRVPQILRAFAGALAYAPNARLALVGSADARLDLPSLVSTLGIGHAVVRVERPDEEMFDRLIAAVDVSLNLRWPTALEMSGPWLRAISAGRATVIMDLAHQAHLPVLDPRTWRCAIAGADPLAVSIDVVDEDHSLRLALRRLACDPELRENLGRAARRYWEDHHTLARMAGDYERLIALAVSTRLPPPISEFPPASPLAPIRTLLETVGLPAALAVQFDDPCEAGPC